jgi:hypothetical protein
MTRRIFARALTLIEALLLLVIISIVAVAAGVGLQAVAKVPAATDNIMSINTVLVSVMEQTHANLIRNWPASTWGGPNCAFFANGISYTPPANIAFRSSYTTPITGTSPKPLQINGKPYQVSLILATADPVNPGGTSPQSDFIQITVVAAPVIAGTVDSTSTQRLVTYVAQP